MDDDVGEIRRKLKKKKDKLSDKKEKVKKKMMAIEELLSFFNYYP